MNMRDIHPTIITIITGRKLKTTERLALEDPAWVQAWPHLNNDQRAMVAERWLKQLHSRASNASSMSAGFPHVFIKNHEWVATIYPYVKASWFDGQKLGGQDGLLWKNLGFSNDTACRLLEIAWRGSLEERSHCLLTEEFSNVMGAYPFILTRLWDAATETGVTQEHKVAMAKHCGDVGFLVGTTAKQAPPFRQWQEFGRLLSISKPSYDAAEINACRTFIKSLPFEDSLLPLVHLLKRAASTRSGLTNSLNRTVLLPDSDNNTPYTFLKKWYPQEKQTWATAEELGIDAEVAVQSILNKNASPDEEQAILPTFAFDSH